MGVLVFKGDLSSTGGKIMITACSKKICIDIDGIVVGTAKRVDAGIGYWVIVAVLQNDAFLGE